MPPTLILFTRAPQPGRVKTRLIPALGPDGAADLHRRLGLRTLRTARAAAWALDARLAVHHAGPGRAMRAWLGDDLDYHRQVGDDLGARMAAALGAESLPAVLVGTDCPELTPRIIRRAFDVLRKKQIVLGPARDGGYYLVGWRAPQAEVFRDIPWGTADVLAHTRHRMAAADLDWGEVTTLGDIDRPEDLARLPREL